jgi:hypothetical protein
VIRAARAASATAEPEDDDGKFPARDQRGAGAELPAACHLVPGGRVGAGEQLGDGGDGGERERGGEHRWQGTGLDGQSDGKEERGGEQVAQRGQDGAGSGSEWVGR